MLIIEKFEAYLRYSKEFSLNEGDETSDLTLEDILKYMDALIAKQREISDESETKTMKETFLKYKDDPRKAWDEYVKIKSEGGKNWEYVNKSSGKKTNQGKFLDIRYATYAWESIDESTKKELAKFLLGEAIRKGYKNLNQLMREVKRKDRATSVPYIGASIEKTETPKEEPPKEPVENSLFGEKLESGLFKDNKFEFNDESFASPEVKDEMLELITGVIDAIQAKRLIPEEILISSSSSRYRNTPSGGGNSLSWGELSYGRALTLAKVIKKVAESRGMQEGEFEKLREKIKLDFYGENGDGTSGPNPPEGIKFGYYNDKDEFISGEDRNKVVVWELDEEGNPIKEKETLEKEPLSDSKDYNEFRYINVTIKGKFEKDGDEPDVIRTKSKSEDVELYGTISSKNGGGGGGGSSTFNWPKGRNKKVRKTSNKPLNCPVF